MKSILCALIALLTLPGNIHADILDFATIDIDLTDPASSELCDWTPTKSFTINENGLGFDDGPPTVERMDVSIVTHPVPIAYTWRTASRVAITAEMHPHIQSVKSSDGKRPSRKPGTLFARHSPDLKDWSDWSVIPRNAETNNLYVGSIALPRAEKTELREITAAYRQEKGDAWDGNEESAIRWWIDRNPNYFESNKPFIGYVQLMYEGQLDKGVRLRRIKARASWWISGLGFTAQNEPNVANTPWRFTTSAAPGESEMKPSQHLRALIEEKYDSPVEEFEVIDYSPTTKVLWFDWEKDWWGAMNVVETGDDGSVRFFFDIPQPPTAQSIHRVRVVELSGVNYLEVIDRTHMGNGDLHLYRIENGIVKLVLKARVSANISVHFDPPIANVIYDDLNNDGHEDVLITAQCVDGQIADHSNIPIGEYRREFLFDAGQFREKLSARMGRDEVMD